MTNLKGLENSFQEIESLTAKLKQQMQLTKKEGVMSERAQDYYNDHFDQIAEDYFNDDDSGDLALIGEFVLNNAKLFTLFVEEWAKLPDNADKIRQWFMESLPQNDEDGIDR